MFWLPLILSAAGGVASYAGQKQSANAQANVWSQYRQRNKAREAEANAQFEKNLGKSGADTYNAETRAGETRRQNIYAQLQGNDAGAPTTLPTTTNRTVGTPTPSKAAVKHAGSVWQKMMNKAQSKLGAPQDWALNQAQRNNRTNQEIARISDAARSDLNNVVPVELNAAARKGDALAGFGSLLSAAGLISGMGAATGAWGQAAGAGVPANAVDTLEKYVNPNVPLWGG